MNLGLLSRSISDMFSVISRRFLPITLFLKKVDSEINSECDINSQVLLLFTVMFGAFVDIVNILKSTS
jgi:hypothetical protein